MVIASHNRERDRRREGVAMKFIIRVLPVVALLFYLILGLPLWIYALCAFRKAPWASCAALAGVILAVPMLAIAKIICDRVRPLAAFGHFLEG